MEQVQPDVQIQEMRGEMAGASSISVQQLNSMVVAHREGPGSAYYVFFGPERDSGRVSLTSEDYHERDLPGRGKWVRRRARAPGSAAGPARGSLSKSNFIRLKSEAGPAEVMGSCPWLLSAMATMALTTMTMTGEAMHIQEPHSSPPPPPPPSLSPLFKRFHSLPSAYPGICFVPAPGGMRLGDLMAKRGQQFVCPVRAGTRRRPDVLSAVCMKADEYKNLGLPSYVLSEMEGLSQEERDSILRSVGLKVGRGKTSKRKETSAQRRERRKKSQAAKTELNDEVPAQEPKKAAREVEKGTNARAEDEFFSDNLPQSQRDLDFLKNIFGDTVGQGGYGSQNQSQWLREAAAEDEKEEAILADEDQDQDEEEEEEVEEGGGSEVEEVDGKVVAGREKRVMVFPDENDIDPYNPQVKFLFVCAKRIDILTACRDQTFGYTMLGYVQGAHGVRGEFKMNCEGECSRSRSREQGQA
eukprot:747784-Hanusia_phi.AAC.3